MDIKKALDELTDNPYNDVLHNTILEHFIQLKDEVKKYHLLYEKECAKMFDLKYDFEQLQKENERRKKNIPVHDCMGNRILPKETDA